MKTEQNKILVFDQISFRYSDTPVLTDVTFFLDRGEFLGILGPNGSGKTTLIKLCNRILCPQRGIISLDDHYLHNLKQIHIAQKVSMVAQENIFPFNFTAFEIVLMGRHPFISMLGFEKKQDKEIVKDIMHMLKIDHLANRKFPSLSGGEKQRTLFASALAQTPQLLLLDEPTSAMDVKHQIEIYKILKDLQSKKGLSILTVTHDINTAAMFCDRFILLKEGKVIDTGNPSAVLTKSKIKNLYDIDVSILNHPIYKTPLVFPN